MAVPGSRFSRILSSVLTFSQTYDAYELVTTIRWTFGSVAAASRRDLVPATAGLIKSSGFSTFQWKGDAVCIIALFMSLWTA